MQNILILTKVTDFMYSVISLVEDFSELHKQFETPQPCAQMSEKLGGVIGVSEEFSEP